MHVWRALQAPAPPLSPLRSTQFYNDTPVAPPRRRSIRSLQRQAMSPASHQRMPSAPQNYYDAQMRLPLNVQTTAIRRPNTLLPTSNDDVRIYAILCSFLEIVWCSVYSSFPNRLLIF
jgi:hypothetical protein